MFVFVFPRPFLHINSPHSRFILQSSPDFHRLIAQLLPSAPFVITLHHHLVAFHRHHHHCLPTSIISSLLVSPPVPPYHIHILSFVTVAMPNTVPAGSIPMPQVGSRVFFWDVNSQIKFGTIVGTARMTDMTMVVDIQVDGGSIASLPMSSVSCVT
jgi:hypothetical protein